MKKSRTLTLLAALAAVIAAGVWGFSTLSGASAGIDPASVATVERGTMVRSVVATGKIEPITKVDIESKANGIIERLLADVDQVVHTGQVLGELDEENLTARLREARANLQAAEAAREAAVAQVRKNEIEAEAPDVAFAHRNQTRAQQLFEQRLVSHSALDEAMSALQQAENRQRAAEGQLVIARARVVETTANVASTSCCHSSSSGSARRSCWSLAWSAPWCPRCAPPASTRSMRFATSSARTARVSSTNDFRSRDRSVGRTIDACREPR